MSRFIQMHILTSYPPSNLNRDDLGRPKTAKMGGVDRLRISSQSLKRAWRTSDIFQESLSGNIGKRTKRLGKAVYDYLVEKGADAKKAKEWAKLISEQFGKPKKESKSKELEDLEIEQIAHIGNEEWKDIFNLADLLVAENRKPETGELDLLRKKQATVDIALFGRMLASKPDYSVEAAAQVAHALTVHPVTVEDDYFTAVDDLNRGEEDAGAGHVGEAGFAAGLFYLYTCINRELLKENLNGDKDLTNKTIEAFVDAALKVAPSGKQNSFASRSYASYVLAEKGNQQPRSLSVAFLKPVIEQDMLKGAIDRLEDARNKMDQAYGDCADDHKIMNVDARQGNLKDIQSFVKE
ncbi:MAG: type I-E CRISPR-associated protein Cas7/Cse4/CasC [Dissulfuribacterales bacterium]